MIQESLLLREVDSNRVMLKKALLSYSRSRSLRTKVPLDTSRHALIAWLSWGGVPSEAHCQIWRGRHLRSHRSSVRGLNLFPGWASGCVKWFFPGFSKEWDPSWQSSWDSMIFVIHVFFGIIVIHDPLTRLVRQAEDLQSPKGSTAAGRAWPSDRVHFCWKNGPFPWDEAIRMARSFWEATSFVYSHSLMLVFVFRKIFWTSLCHTLSISVDFSLSRCRVEVTQIGGASSWSCCWRDGDSFSKRANGLVLGMIIPHRLHIFCQVPRASGKRIAIQDTGSVHGWVLALVWWINPKLPGVFKSVHFFIFLSAWWSLIFSILFHSSSKSPSSNFLRLVWCRPAVKLWFASLKRMGEFSDLTFFFERWRRNVVLTVEWYSYFLNDASNTRVNLVNGKHQAIRAIQGTVPLQLWTCSGIGMSTTSPPLRGTAWGGSWEEETGALNISEHSFQQLYGEITSQSIFGAVHWFCRIEAAVKAARHDHGKHTARFAGPSWHVDEV